MKVPSVLPEVGAWYRSHGLIFEVVAADDDDGTIEIQYHDGSLEEMEMEDWASRVSAGTLQAAEQPEDFSGAIDYEPEESLESLHPPEDAAGTLRADGLEGLDLFE